jgi:serine phosphatase RsbU (regulator of sigma subunit)
VSDYKVYQLLTLKQKPIVYDEKIGLKNYRILSFLVDNEGNQWFGFSGGMQKLTNKSLRTFFPDQLDSYINSAFEDKKGRMWFGMSKNIYYFKEKLVNFSEIINSEEKSFVISQAPDGNIVIANSEGIYLIDVETLKIIKQRKFDTKLFYLEDIYISFRNEIFLLSGNNGAVYYLKNFDEKVINIENSATSLVTQLTEFDGVIIGANNSGLVIFKDSTFTKLVNTKGQVWSIAKDIEYDPVKKVYTEILWVGTQAGLAKYKNGKLEYIENEDIQNKAINAIKPADDKSKLWLGTDKGVIYFNKNTNEIEFTVNSKDGLLGNEISIDGIYLDGRGLLWIGTYHGISTFDIKKKKIEKTTPICRIESYSINGEIVTEFPKILKYNQNNIIFEISGLSFKDEFSVEYEFYLQGLDENYQTVGEKNIASYPNLPPGKYSFKYRTKGKDGIWSYYQNVNFKIEKPFYFEWWFILGIIALIILFVYRIFKWRIKILQKRNEQLEITVIERTAEIREKNAELETQKEEIQTQRDFAEQQRDEIAQRKKEIDDSILYAKRIQNAIMPPESLISSLLPENFILFKPRDIVSGDYYWFAEKNNKIYYAAADCTGHGVPGAFMSMLGVSFLNDIITASENEIKASEVLDELRLKIIYALHQTGEVHEAKDGMDIALCVIDYVNMEVQFAGAFNPLFIIRNEDLIVVNADRMPIGIYEYEGDKNSFTNNVLKLHKGDLLYVFSDGYADQFGGPAGKKFMLGRFKKVLEKIKDLSMEEQRQYLDDTIEKWRKGVSPQIDDILVMGVRI